MTQLPVILSLSKDLSGTLHFHIRTSQSFRHGYAVPPTFTQGGLIPPLTPVFASAEILHFVQNDKRHIRMGRRTRRTAKRYVAAKQNGLGKFAEPVISIFFYET